MGTEPEIPGSSGGPARRFRKVWGSEGLRVGALPGQWGRRARGRWLCPLTAARSQISKPLMEKKRRARINVSLEQLRSLLEKHYSHQVGHRDVAVVAGDVVPSLIPSNPGCPAMSPSHGSTDPETQVGEGGHPGAERQVHEKPSELDAR